jgi:hypothetical protein
MGDYLYVDKLLIVKTLGTARSTHLCYDDTAWIVSACTSSIRFKKDVAPFTRGLELLNQLRPVTYNWKQDDQPDLGLIAEEVAKAEPRFATYNKDGQVQGVKYDQLTIVLINAVKEQQAQIDEQRRTIEALRELACAANPRAAVCR